MKTNGTIEEYLLQVDKLFESGNYDAGKKLLEKILELEPDYAKAHSYVGWLYHVKLDNYERAALHYNMAIKFDPRQPTAFMNYILLLNEINDKESVREMITKAFKAEGINKAFLYNELGKSYEINGDYDAAQISYKEAIRYEMESENVKAYKLNICRAREKKALFKKKRKMFLGFF